MSFDQRRYLDEHVPYRLGNLELFNHALRVILSDPSPRNVCVLFDNGHEVRGPFYLFTNACVETGILTCRMFMDFLAGVQKWPDDVVITMFKRRNGDKLRSVPLESVSHFHPANLSEHQTLEALNFTKQAADKGVAHLTLGQPQQENAIPYYQAACLAIRGSVDHCLYEALCASPDCLRLQTQ